MADETGQVQVFPVCSLTATLLRVCPRNSPQLPVPHRHPRGGFLPFVVLSSLHGVLCGAVLYRAARWCYLDPEGVLVFFT